MIKNYVIESANAPGTNLNIVLSGAGIDRLRWRQAYTDLAPAFYFCDDGAQAEWGVCTVHLGTPDFISRDTVIGNTAANTNRLNFTGACQVYNEIPGDRMPFINNGILTVPNGRLDTHAGGVPIGASMDYWGVAAPTGWVFCDGRWLGRVQYAQLFAVLGTTYGAADGASFFALPDVQGQTTYGSNNPSGSGLPSTRLGPWQTSPVGTAIGDWQLHLHSHTLTLTDGQHSHPLFDPGHTHTYLHTDFVSGTNFVAGSGYQQTDTIRVTANGTPQQTGVFMGATVANITGSLSTSGAGNWQNVSPGKICHKILFAGPVP